LEQPARQETLPLGPDNRPPEETMNTPPTNLVPKDERASKPVGAPVGSRSQRVDLLRLRDSTQLLVRPIAPTDKRTLATAYSTLSTDSRWLRFSAHAPTLSERDLAYLTEVDHHTHEALVAIDPSTRAFVGVARYIAIPGSEGEAEVAVAVDDSRQRRGVATGLLRLLAGRAHAEGVRRFVAVVSEENLRVIGILQRSGALRRPSAGQRIYVIELSDLGA
jgi:RimJ/RimL family protein N-acetyltransferase